MLQVGATGIEEIEEEKEEEEEEYWVKYKDYEARQSYTKTPVEGRLCSQ
jgi:hypothetical protein